MIADERPSSDPTAEKATLAAALLSRRARDEARKRITGADFDNPEHELIWDAMRDLDRDQGGLDPISLRSTLADRGHHTSAALVVDLVTYPVIAEQVAHYAERVRSWATRRRLINKARAVEARVLRADIDAGELAASIASDFAAIRDSGSTSDDAQSITLNELLADPDDEPDWVVPGLLERGDRLILTGEEGLGKSYLLRQIAIMARAGLDPFDPGVHIRPVSVLIVDCENSARQVRRKARPVVEFARRYGTDDPGNVNLYTPGRLDITSDRALSAIHREIDATQAEIVVIGPLYRLYPSGVNTDDEATPVLTALDSIRDRGICVLTEAHAGHATGGGGERNLRPRGSSALLGWPEFGYGMRRVAEGYADLVPWRGDRDARRWPDRMRHDSRRIRWVHVDVPISADRQWYSEAMGA